VLDSFTPVHFGTFAGEASRIFYSLLGDFFPAVTDITTVPEWPTIEPQDRNAFNVEMETSWQWTKAFSLYGYLNRQGQEVFELETGLAYQLTETVSIYGGVLRSRFPTDTPEAADVLQPLVDYTFRLGMVKTWRDGELEGSINVYQTFAQTVSAVEAERLVNNYYTRRGIEATLEGKLLPQWVIEATYTYADTQQPDVFLHSAELITTYEIPHGRLQGWGVTGGLGWESNTFLEPAYLRADAGIFYRGQRLRAYLTMENLFALDARALGNCRNNDR
jgi:outer membrane receptor for ferric coprogen and ferric-rhodotorulic acid